MSRIIFSILFPLMACGTLSSQDVTPPDKTDFETEETQAIQVFMDSVEGDTLKDEKFCVIIPYNKNSVYIRPAHLVAWFKYSQATKFVTVNYIIFPMAEFYREREVKDPLLWDARGREFTSFLKKIIEQNTIAHLQDVKQLKVRLPIGLRDDVLFEEMRRISPPVGFVRLGGGVLFYFGLKSAKIEYTRSSSDYLNLDHQIHKDIISPIEIAILEHETPKHWIKDAKRHDKEMAKDWRNRLTKDEIKYQKQSEKLWKLEKKLIKKQEKKGEKEAE